MRVDITDFQSIATASLDVRGLTVIVGPSNRGKSALLRAIEGALFNRAGDQFARVRPDGTVAQNAVVALGNVPTHDRALTDVTWTKGRANKYTIDREDYSRVGAEAPQLLQDMGFRDVFVGDEARKSGERIRPQVGTQHEGLFLLGRPGSFIADTLGLLSRQAAVAAAQGRCASDLRSLKQLIGVRTTDLATATERAEIIQLPSAVAVDALLAAARKVEALRTLLAQRAQVQTVPTKDVSPGAATFAAGVLAQAASVTQALQLLRRRRDLGAVPAALPANAEAVCRDAHTWAKLVAGRRAVQRLQGLLTALPPQRKGHAVSEETLTQIRQLTDLVRQQATTMGTVHQTQQAARELATEEDAATAALHDALAGMEVCPTCDRPMGPLVTGTLEERPTVNASGRVVKRRR